MMQHFDVGRYDSMIDCASDAPSAVVGPMALARWLGMTMVALVDSARSVVEALSYP
jgi:hypothetical protein